MSKFKNNSKKKSTLNKNQSESPQSICLINSKLKCFDNLFFTKAFSEKANRLGIFTTQQLVTHLPIRYEDLSRIIKLKDAISGQYAQFEVIIKSLQTQGFGRKRRYRLQVTDGSTDVLIRFFNLYPAQLNLLKPGISLRIYGELKVENYLREFFHPRWQLADKAPKIENKYSPIYPLTSGLNQIVLSNQIKKALERMPDEILPDEIVADQNFSKKLPLLKRSLKQLHFPTTDQPLEFYTSIENPYRKRLAFDELLSLQILLNRLRQKFKTRKSYALANEHFVEKLKKNLPFKLTSSQLKVWREIKSDLENHTPMARLLQGDVGSGKTIISLMACLKAISSNRQAVIMAPTEILAEQHYQRFCSFLRPLGINIGWLSSATKPKERSQLANLVKQKLINLVVGTHALIEETLTFPELALAIIDEQQRFGVLQRIRLQERKELSLDFAPHQLMMSATPIPRTLAMSYYSHLDVSTIDELPPGRKPIKTRMVNATRRNEIIDFLNSVVKEGRQVYWVCPLIEESSTLQLQTAEQTYQNLANELPELAIQNKIGLLHGKMNSTERNQVITKFVENNISLLVSTTIIEVGVDIANACYMVIENAERFGLSQLHQLRGRIGRGSHQSMCILLFQEPLTEIAKMRLKAIYQNLDGFTIAQEDLRLRGPGEIVGDKQSGLPTLRFANLAADYRLLLLAKELTPKMILNYPDRANQLIEFYFGRNHQLYST